MTNYNNGYPQDLKEIKNYLLAIKDFSEGSLELEKLLLLCYEKEIETTSCCKGHEEKGHPLYIAFKINDNNLNFLCLLLTNLSDAGYDCRYLKAPNNRSSFSVTDDHGYSQVMFNKICELVQSYDKSKDYYSTMPEYLKKYISIVHLVEGDSREFAYGKNSFQFGYTKDLKEEEYNYFVFTSEDDYISSALSNGFKVNNEAFCPYLYLASKVVEELGDSLSGMENDIRLGTFKKSIK